MPGVVQHTQESLRKEVRALADLGVPAVILFGVPTTKDARGSGADDPDGVVQVALRNLRDEVGDSLVLMADDCLDEYTDHGHCGLLTDAGEVDNDSTLERYASIADRAGRRGRRRDRPVGDDGRPGRGHPRRARRVGQRRRRDPRLRGEVRVGALRPVPRRRRVRAAVRRPARLPDGPAQRPRGARRDRARHRRGRRHGDGQAGAALPRHRARAARLVRRAGGGVPRERRVRDAQGRGRRTAGSTATPPRSRRSRRSSAPAPTSCSPTSRASSPNASRERSARKLAVRARAGASFPAASTRRCARSRRSAAIPSSSTAPRARTSSTPTVVATSTTCSRGARRSSGHAHPAVVEAVQRAAAAGTSYGAPTEREVELAEAIAARVPSVDKVRLVSSGTEAGMTAVRLARGATGRAEDPEVRRLLPRPRRRAARRRRQRRRHPRPARLGRASPRAPWPTPSSSPTTTTPRSTPPSTATAPTSRR